MTALDDRGVDLTKPNQPLDELLEQDDAAPEPVFLDEDETPREVVETDPPAPPPTARHRGEMRPLVADQYKSRAAFEKHVRWKAHVGAHAVAFHAINSPIYAWRLAVRSPRGAARVVGKAAWWVRNGEEADARAVALASAAANRAEGFAQSNTLQIRRDSRFHARLPIVAAGGVATVAGYGAMTYFTGGLTEVAANAAIIAALGHVGSNRDKPAVTRALLPGGIRKLTTDRVERAVVAAGLATEKTPIEWKQGIARDGVGYRAVFYLPPGKTVGQLVKASDKLASGLDVQESQLWITKVRGTTGSERLASMWVADEDPQQVPAGPSPLIKLPKVDVWKSDCPLGVNARGHTVAIPLLWQSMLVGGLPRRGKTFFARQLAVFAALDPYVRLYMYDGKGSPDWARFADVAHRCGFGLVREAGRDPAEDLMADMLELKDEAERRYPRLRKLPERRVPEGKLTRELARDPDFDMPFTLVVLDEVQEYLEHPQIGKDLLEVLTYLVRVAPGAGISVLSATQKPSDKSVPTMFRDQHQTRFALPVGSWQVSDVILGALSAAGGLDASKLDPELRGVGLLKGVSAASDGLVRGFLLDGQDCKKVLAGARERRESHGTLSGHALEGRRPKPVAPRFDLLEDILQVAEMGVEKVRSEDLCAALGEFRPDTYGGWDQTLLARALGTYGLDTCQINRREGGRKVNKRGVEIAAVRDAVRDRGPVE